MDRDLGDARRLYRIVQHDPPTREDFQSNAARGRPLPGEPEFARLHDGLSTFASLDQAARKARQYPMLGRFVAELVISDSSGVRIERTILRSRGHHTVWGTPEMLLGCVVRVQPVDRDEE